MAGRELVRWTEFYVGNCPKCGGGLTTPDENDERRCERCHLTIGPAIVTLEEI